MKATTVTLLSALVATALAAPAQRSHVVHEKRELERGLWQRSDVQIKRDTVVPMSIGLKQRNLDKGYEYLMDVAHPDSKNFGKHWSYDKIRETFKPSDESVDAVRAWLTESGIAADRVKLSAGQNWLKAQLTIAEIEELLKTEYSVYSHAQTGQPHIACDEYSVPADVSDHIDFITPTINFDAMIKAPKQRRELSTELTPGLNQAWNPKKGATIRPQTLDYTLDTCDQYITPACLQALYGLSNGTSNSTSYGIVEYTPQAYLQSDLDLFYANLSLGIPEGTGPMVDLIDGAVVQTDDQGFNYNGESDLDIEYAIALVYPQTVTLYQVGDETNGASFNNFLDAIDGSYCSYEGGDDPSNDAIYPNPDCGTFAPTSVISTSYGYNEADLSASYEQRQCDEYMKLGLAGVTVLYSSGDYGVAGNSGACCREAGCAGGKLNLGGSGTFNPSFPGSCPYVTSVGATQVASGASVTEPEQACETVIYSGGGFSNVFTIPDYQADAVATYFADHTPSYTATQYNNTGTSRGIPDVAANGANYVVAVAGEISLIYGTSASSPTFGSIITLINEERVAAGKGAVGFLNPTLYANPDAFTDITTGSNPGCGTDGFAAVEGWDPVTGLGTPVYSKLRDVFLSLA